MAKDLFHQHCSEQSSIMAVENYNVGRTMIFYVWSRQVVLNLFLLIDVFLIVINICLSFYSIFCLVN